MIYRYDIVATNHLTEDAENKTRLIPKIRFIIRLLIINESFHCM